MADAIAITKEAREKRIAVDRIVGFAKQFGEEHLNLACHAAFPLAPLIYSTKFGQTLFRDRLGQRWHGCCCRACVGR